MRKFFYLQRGDRRIIAVLAVTAVAAVALLLGLGYGGAEMSTATTDSTVSASLREGRSGSGIRRHYVGAVADREIRLSHFDPNTADSTRLLALGLAPWQVRSIYKYRAAGGTYRRPSDFAHVYGLTARQYKMLEPYIRISADYRSAIEVYDTRAADMYYRDTTRYPLKITKERSIALNSADTSLLKTVPGIGSHFARQIVYYRDKLGGFYDVSQLREISGFPLDAIKYFVIRNKDVRRINLNSASKSELRRHPYLGFYQAQTIIEHRRMKGPLRSIDDLRLYRDFPDKVIERLRPYAEL